jgi:hypothetical protein
LNSRGFFFLLLFSCISAFLPALGSKEKDVIVRVTGIVRLVGGGLKPQLVITGTGKEWYVPNEEQSKLMDFQHQTVIVEGVETVENLRFANGISAGERRTLEKIKIIEILENQEIMEPQETGKEIE